MPLDRHDPESLNTSLAAEGKVVYVLGAGFSIPAGAPSQAQILADIFSLDEHSERFLEARQKLRDFLEEDLRIDAATIERAVLEDIYTPIDRCIADGTSLKSKSAMDLQKIREELGYLISHTIARRIDQNLHVPGAGGYVNTFADHLVSKAARRAELAAETDDSSAAKEYDPFSIISLNWDILLDNALHQALGNRHHGPFGDYDPFGVVDYCCYISSLDSGDPRIRSGLWSLGCRGYNVKLLKLHGSMNWLQCPNCQRLFVQFGVKALDRLGRTPCRHCLKYGHKNHLAGSLVMPTFLKDLSNFQIKLVWQNAGVELMEAKRLVFIGYSLPHADFEFRQLLSRMVHRDAEVDVVLYEGSDDDAKRRYRAEQDRYRQFFGNRRLRFYSAGVVDFVNTLVVAAISRSARPVLG
jgi:hypothetical protein